MTSFVSATFTNPSLWESISPAFSSVDFFETSEVKKMENVTEDKIIENWDYYAEKAEEYKKKQEQDKKENNYNSKVIIDSYNTLINYKNKKYLEYLDIGSDMDTIESLKAKEELYNYILEDISKHWNYYIKSNSLIK